MGYIEKNISVLDKFIVNNKDNIRLIITSVEIFELLKSYKDCEIIDDTLLKYKNIKVIKYSYYPSKKLGFIMKDQEIEFDLRCSICEEPIK